MEVEDERFEPFRKLLTEIPLTTAEQAGFVCPGGGRETDRVTAGSISVGRKPLKTKVHPLPDRLEYIAEQNCSAVGYVAMT